jgi:hypothetical protein
VVQEQLVELALQQRRIGQIAQPEAAARHLVLVGRADAAAGGADLARAGVGAFAGALAQPVQLAVERQDQGHVLGDAQALGGDGEALGAQALDLVEERPRVDDDAVAHDRELAAPHHARGQERQLVGLAVDDERVARVVAALKAHHDVGPLAQPVDDLALALVAPLRADDRYVRHAVSVPRRSARDYARPCARRKPRTGESRRRVQGLVTGPRQASPRRP